MPPDISRSFHGLRSAVPFWSLRLHHETREVLAMRQDTLEPPRLSVDRGAMLSAVVEGGYGYCATSDLSASGLQQALDRATRWAEATRGKSVVRYEPAKFGAPRGEYESSAGAEPPSRRAIHDLLAAECKAAQADERLVERFAALGLYEQERLYMTNTGGEVRQRFRFTVPYMRVTANKGTVTQARSLDYEQQGGFDLVECARFVGSGARLADEALQLLAAPNCPSEKMELLLMPDQMMLQVHESIGHPLDPPRHADAYQRLVVNRRFAQQVPVRLRMGRADRGGTAYPGGEESELPRRLGHLLAEPARGRRCEHLRGPRHALLRQG